MISIVLTELRPSFTLVRTASPFGFSLNRPTVLFFLAECRPSDVDDVVELFEADRAVDAQIGPGAGRQLRLRG